MPAFQGNCSDGIPCYDNPEFMEWIRIELAKKKPYNYKNNKRPMDDLKVGDSLVEHNIKTWVKRIFNWNYY